MTQELISDIKDRFLVFEDIGLDVTYEYIFNIDNMELVGSQYEFEKIGIAILIKVSEKKNEPYDISAWKSIFYTKDWLKKLNIILETKYLRMKDNLQNPIYFIYENKYEHKIKEYYPETEYNESSGGVIANLTL